MRKPRICGPKILPRLRIRTTIHTSITQLRPAAKAQFQFGNQRMTDAQQNLFDRLTDSWVEASRLLDIRVDAPFAASSEGVAVKAVAFLPDFGGLEAGFTILGASSRRIASSADGSSHLRRFSA